MDALTSANEPIAVDEVKRATSFGDSGSVLVTELANADGVTFTQAKNAVETAYRAGYTNLDKNKKEVTESGNKNRQESSGTENAESDSFRKTNDNDEGHSQMPQSEESVLVDNGRASTLVGDEKTVHNGRNENYRNRVTENSENVGGRALRRVENHSIEEIIERH